MAATVIIEPLDKAKHDRAAFASGVEQVDRYLRETASRLMKAKRRLSGIATRRNGRRPA